MAIQRVLSQQEETYITILVLDRQFGTQIREINRELEISHSHQVSSVLAGRDIHHHTSHRQIVRQIDKRELEPSHGHQVSSVLVGRDIHHYPSQQLDSQVARQTDSQSSIVAIYKFCHTILDHKLSPFMLSFLFLNLLLFLEGLKTRTITLSQ